MSKGEEKYCGFWSILIGVTLFPCICMCPVDRNDNEPICWVPWQSRTGGRVKDNSAPSPNSK